MGNNNDSLVKVINDCIANGSMTLVDTAEEKRKNKSKKENWEKSFGHLRGNGNEFKYRLK